MEKLILEIRAAEGGQDSKDLVTLQLSVYAKYAVRKGLKMTIVRKLPGKAIALVEGEDCFEGFKNEPGGHRVQRVPPTEKRGRCHTSTITVSCLPVPSEAKVRLNPRDLEWKACRGSGAGGQHRNKTDSAVQLTHGPSGLTVRCESERSQHQNKRLAREMLRSKLLEREEAKQGNARSAQRKRQVGTGMRGDKVRTIALQRGRVVDHKLGRRMSAKNYLKGEIEKLWA